MSNQINYSIFLFTRDLRLVDNTSLIVAAKKSKYVIPVFIFTKEQLSKNQYKSDNCVQFMCESLDDLNHDLDEIGSKLFCFYGEFESTLKSIIRTSSKKIDGVFYTKDYTPFSKTREKQIEKICNNEKIFCEGNDDYLLTKFVGSVLNSSGRVFVKFTPFLRSASKQSVGKPSGIKPAKLNLVLKKGVSFSRMNEMTKSDYHAFYKKNNNLIVRGGRSNAILILKSLKKFSSYGEDRNYPEKYTTLLSPYLKFNVVSVREVYHYITKSLGKSSKLITQLYWRDFYMILMDVYPDILNYNMNKSKIKWSNADSSKSKTILFEKWKNGLTGFPFVDAGMRQLNTIGWMHNRVRMVAACLLVKIMGINWKDGERYFATKLVDYDPCNNNGGWQWVAGTGTDSQPYFRYFNPWTQSKTYDVDAAYIKKWIPELSKVPAKDIHKWNESYDIYQKKYQIDYPKPLFSNVSEKFLGNIMKK